MNKRDDDTLQNKIESNKYSEPPVKEDETSRSDVKRKQEEIKNSTIGGF